MTLHTEAPDEAAALLRAGGVVAFPTETVYGLGADLFNEAALAQIFAAKGRPADNPLIAHLATLDQLDAVAASVPAAARALIDAFFPGPLTVILPKHASVPALATGGLGTVGVRMPAHPVAQAFLHACARPVAAPSANRSGRPSPTRWQAVAADLDGRIAAILKGGASEVGLESTVVDCTTDVPVVLRAGVVTLEALQVVLPATRLAGPDAEALARSPGTRYRHYAPRAHVVLVPSPAAAPQGMSHGYIGLEAPPGPGRYGLVQPCRDVADYAHSLFAFFRRCDAAGLTRVYCQTVAPQGLGLALMDRLRRAAAR